LFVIEILLMMADALLILQISQLINDFNQLESVPLPVKRKLTLKSGDYDPNARIEQNNNHHIEINANPLKLETGSKLNFNEPQIESQAKLASVPIPTPIPAHPTQPRASPAPPTHIASSQFIPTPMPSTKQPVSSFPQPTIIPQSQPVVKPVPGQSPLPSSSPAIQQQQQQQQQQHTQAQVPKTSLSHPPIASKAVDPNEDLDTLNVKEMKAVRRGLSESLKVPWNEWLFSFFFVLICFLFVFPYFY
jgi:hypothetical protein